MRGRTLDDAFVILDEAQNATAEQMKMFLTRLGMNSKAIVTGDITQIDLPDSQKSGLTQIAEILVKIEGIQFVYFSEQDVVRHRLVKDIIKAYDQFEHDSGSSNTNGQGPTVIMPHGHLVSQTHLRRTFRPCTQHDSTCRAVNISTSRASHCTAEPLIGRQDTHAQFKPEISRAGLSDRCPGVPNGEYAENRQKSFWEMSSYACPLLLGKPQGSRTQRRPRNTSIVDSWDASSSRL